MGNYYYTKFKFSLTKSPEANQVKKILKAIKNRESLQNPNLNEQLMFDSEFFDNSRHMMIFSDAALKYHHFQVLSPDQTAEVMNKFESIKYSEEDKAYGVFESTPIYESYIKDREVQVVCSTKDINLILDFMHFVKPYVDFSKSDPDITIFDETGMPVKYLWSPESLKEFSVSKVLPFTYVKKEYDEQKIKDFIEILNNINLPPVEMANLKLISNFVVENRNEIFLFLHSNKMVPSELFDLFIEVGNIPGNETLFKAFFQ